MDISLSLESAIRRSVIMQNELKLAAESVSKIDSKIPTKSQNSKCFRCSGQHNLKACPFIDRNVSFVKTRDIIQKSPERKLNQIYQLNNFQMSFQKQLMRANLMKIFLRFTS